LRAGWSVLAQVDGDGVVAVMIGRGHKSSPKEPVDIWLDSAPKAVHERIGLVHPQLVGQDEATVLAELKVAGISGPADALAGLAARISATERWMLAPNGTEWTDDKGRKHRITNRVHAQVRTEFRKSE
jgi:hypothetical protein